MNKELLNILACPRCHGALELFTQETAGTAEEGLCCRACALLYPIRDNIPVMLIEEAKPCSCEKGEACACS